MELSRVALRDLGEGRLELCDRHLALHWREWHAEHAVLRLVSARANLQANAVGKARLKAGRDAANTDAA